MNRVFEVNAGEVEGARGPSSSELDSSDMIADQGTNLIAADTKSAPVISPERRPRFSLPEEPLVKIRPTGPGLATGPGELWAYRELLQILMWRDFKVRYKQTLLGAAWVVLQPLLMAIVFTLFLGRAVRAPADALPYALFAYSGLLLWTFFSNAVLSASHSLIASAHVINKVYFPRLLVPVATVGVRLLDLGITSVILVLLMIYYGVQARWGMLMAPLLVALITLLALACGILFSALNVRYRDIGTMLPVMLQLWMFVSPVVYPLTIVPENVRWLCALNPLTGIVVGFRATLFGERLDWFGIATSAMTTLALLIYALWAFRRTEDVLADVI